MAKMGISVLILMPILKRTLSLRLLWCQAGPFNYARLYEEIPGVLDQSHLPLPYEEFHDCYLNSCRSASIKLQAPLSYVQIFRTRRPKFFSQFVQSASVRSLEANVAGMKISTAVLIECAPSSGIAS